MLKKKLKATHSLQLKYVQHLLHSLLAGASSAAQHPRKGITPEAAVRYTLAVPQKCQCVAELKKR